MLCYYIFSYFNCNIFIELKQFFFVLMVFIVTFFIKIVESGTCQQDFGKVGQKQYVCCTCFFHYFFGSKINVFFYLVLNCWLPPFSFFFLSLQPQCPLLLSQLPINLFALQVDTPQIVSHIFLSPSLYDSCEIILYMFSFYY